MVRRLTLRHLSIVGVLFSLMFYQNCAQAPDNTNDAESYESMLPFAFSATIDTLAYMSCSNMTDATFTSRAYFSFRAGAYSASTGGITPTSAFYTATKYYTAQNRGIAMQGSQFNSNTVLSLSIRSASNYQNLWQTSSVQPGYELDTMLPALDTDEVVGPFAAVVPGAMINYFPSSDTQRLMEGSLRFLDSEANANLTRNTLGSGASMLVVGYAGTSDALDETLRSPLDVSGTVDGAAPTTIPATETNANTVFGTGYSVAFGLPSGYSAGDARVLSSAAGITEKNLATNVHTNVTWDCNANYEFMIVRPEDITNNLVVCNATVDRPTTTAQSQALTAIRRVLRVEDWWVDLAHHCVVPKNTGDYCYGGAANMGTRVVSYGTTACVDSDTTSPPTVCPHFVSVCLRQ